MKSFTIASALLAGSALLTSVTATLDPISIKGQHFFYKNGTEFFIRGVAYQADVNSNGTISGSPTATYSDPLADVAGCTRDIPILQQLRTNVIRVYAINASLDHSQCMSMLDAAGIYVIQDLSNPSNSINRDNPSWTLDLFTGYAAVIDTMAQYTNTLGFFAGNEVSNDVNNTAASAFVKAAVRDSKAYIKQKGYRTIGVGYATNDDANIRGPLADYFNCGDPASAIDFWGYNIYSWCGQSSFTESGYDQRVAEFANYTVPVFFAEYGCVTPPRLFTEVGSLFSSNMTGVFSGGIVYMYFEEANNYGLVSVSGNSVSKLPSFTSYSAEIAKASPTGTAQSAYVVSNTVARACPTVGAGWSASSNLPPIANSDLCSCMVTSLSCVAKPGLSPNATQAIFDYICGSDPKACAGILGNATNAVKGVYGAYSMCYPSQMLSYVINQYYLDNNKASTACDFSGQAQTQSGSQNPSCSGLIAQAGTAGTGVVTSIPTGAPAASGTIGSTTGGAAAAASSSKGVAGSLVIPRFDIGLLQLGVYVAAAVMAGAGMVLL